MATAIVATNHQHIVNLTPYRFVKTIEHKYLTNKLSWSDIPSGRAVFNTVEYDWVKEPTRNRLSKTEIRYTLEGTDKRFLVRMFSNRSSPHWARIDVDLTYLGGLGQKEFKPPRFMQLIITGSASYGFRASFGDVPHNWMHQMYDTIKDRELRHVVMPGAHNAGSNRFGYDDLFRLERGWKEPCENREINVYCQLRSGARWFDMRLVNTKEVTGVESWAAIHETTNITRPVETLGESLNSIMFGINKFTEAFPGEIIILWVTCE
jgi:hypothetical protein